MEADETTAGMDHAGTWLDLTSGHGWSACQVHGFEHPAFLFSGCLGHCFLIVFYGIRKEFCEVCLDLDALEFLVGLLAANFCSNMTEVHPFSTWSSTSLLIRLIVSASLFAMSTPRRTLVLRKFLCKFLCKPECHAWLHGLGRFVPVSYAVMLFAFLPLARSCVSGFALLDAASIVQHF